MSVPDVEAAWQAYDDAIIRLNEMYEKSGRDDIAPGREARMGQALHVAELWRRFFKLYLADGSYEPRPS